MLADIISEISATNILLAILTLLVSFSVWSYIKRPKDLPPGPRGLPFVGYLPFIDRKELLKQYQEFAREYGDIFSFYLGPRLVVVLNSYEAVKEALVKQKDVFAGRPLTGVLKRTLTIFNVEGELFKEHKRFSLSTLKDFGFGKNSLEPQLKEEIHYLLEEIGSFDGQPTDPGNLIRVSVSNVICALINGKRFDYQNETFQRLVSLVGEHVSRIHPISIVIYFPLLFKIPGIERIINFFRKTPGETDQLFDKELKPLLDKRAADHQPGQRHDFISAWFTEVEQKKKEEADKFYTRAHLTKLVESLFIAGTDTTANSLRWGLMYMMTCPEIQAKVQNEIDEVIGHERMPSLNDQDQMPYTSATLLEIQRISSLVPLSIFHCNTEETKLRNYTIPKRSVIVPNLWAVHHDPKVYPDPDRFMPERFLDGNGKILKAEKLIPFSQGKRQCLGESLARMELFIYFTSLLQRFAFQLPKDEKLDFNFDIAVVAIPKPFKVIAIERKPISKKTRS